MPRKYEITLDDGKKYEVDWDGLGEPTADDIQPYLTQSEPEAEGPSIFGRGLDVVKRVGDTLGRFGSATAAIAKEGVEGFQQGQNLPGMLADMGGAVKDTFTPTGVGQFKRNDDFDKVLGQAGMDEGWGRATLGFVGDVALDPLNVLGPGLARVAGKGLAKAGEVASKSDTLATAGKALTKTFGRPAVAPEMIDNVNDITKGLSYDEMRRLADSQQRSAGEHAESAALDFFQSKGVKPKNAADLPYAIDERRLTGDAAVDALIPEWKKKMDELWQKQLMLGHVDPNSKLDNYVQYHTKSGRPAEVVAGADMRALPNSARKRQVFPSLKEAVRTGGATEDPVEILSHSIAQVEKATRTDEFLRSVKSAFGSSAPKTGYRELNVANLKAGSKLAADLKGTHLPAAIADDLEKAVKLWEEPNELMGFYRNGMKIWKSLATSVNPGHHFTNELGNMHNMYISGMSMKDMARLLPIGYKVARAKSAAALPAIRNYAPKDLWELANEYEIIGTVNHLGETVAKGKLEKIANNPVFKKGRAIGTRYAEEPARMALWLSEIEKGSTPAKAALRVKDVLFDYSELSKTEKGIRDSGLVPFYTWMRKNIPLQIKMMVEHPERVERVGDLMEVPWNAAQSQVDETVIPERAQNGGYVPSALKSNDGSLVMQRLALPSYDINKLADPGAAGDMLGPVPKAIIEAITGNKFFGGKVDKPTGLTTAAPSAALLSPLNYILPDSMEGYITPTDVGGRQLQHDRMSWLMNTFLPTGVYGSTAKASLGEDPTQPGYQDESRALALRLLGMTPDTLSGMDQETEAQRRASEWSRKQARRILMEQ